MIPDFLIKTGSNNNNAKFSNPCTILLISFSLLTESSGQATPPGHGRLEGECEDQQPHDGTPQGSWHREASLSTPLSQPDVYRRADGSGAGRHKQFSPPPAPSEETILLSPPGLALSVPPCPSAAHAPLPRQNSLVRLAQCWLVTGAGKGQGPPCRASVRDGANGPAGQLIGHLRQVSVSPALELLPAGARRHQSSAQGGHQGTIWHHLTGHSAAGA